MSANIRPPKIPPAGAKQPRCTSELRTSAPASTNSMASDSAIASSSQNISTKASIIAAAVEVFAQQTQQWKRKRAPPGLEKKLKATRIADRTTTARILLDYGGFGAWLAYTLATEGKAHFNGRLHQENTIKTFKALPFSDRVNAAQSLARLELSPEATSHIYRISRRLEDKGLLSHPQEEARPNTDPSSETPTENHGSSLHNLKPMRNTSTSASLEGIADVFGEYMCSVIRRVAALSNGKPALRAAVTMQFPAFALHDCVIMLEICEGEVERLVKDLFGIDIMSVMGIRHLLLGKGVKLTSNTSNPEITLKVLLPVHPLASPVNPPWSIRFFWKFYRFLKSIRYEGLAHVRGVMFLDEVTCHQDVLLRIVQNVACALKRC